MSEALKVPAYVQRITIHNRWERPIWLVLEPWGEEHEFPAGEAFVVQGESCEPGELEVEVGEGIVLVYGWNRSIVRLFHAGVELNP